MRIKRFAFFLSTFLIPLSLAASGLAQVDSTTLPKLTEFTQAANENPTLGAIHWINSILQQSNSRYYEGMSVCQRLIFNGVDSTPGDTHALTFSVDATKGGIHAFDFLTSWDNAIPAADSIAPGLNLLVDLFSDQCQPDFWSCTQAICDHIHSLALYDEADLAVLDMDTLAGDDVQLRVDNYDTYFGISRTVKIWGNQAVSSASITFDGYTGSVDDKTANYTLYWTSASDTVIIEMAGHLAVGSDPLEAGIGYGQGRGAANISGGPYHFKLSYLDDKSLGSQDNQIKGADVLLPDLECDVTPSSDAVCVGFDATFTDHSTGGTTPYSWVWTKPPDATVLSTDSVLNISNATLDDSGQYQVVVTDSNSLADTCYAYLTVHPQPACSITGDSTVCEGFTTEFCAISGMVSYSWSGPGGFSANTQCTGQIGTAGYYQVIITNTNGCADTCGRTLVVNAPPVCSITGDSAVCEGFTTEFCATSGMASYSWSGPGGFSANTQCTGQIGVAGYYKVIITDAHGCVDSCGRTLVVNPRPVITAPDTVEFDLCDTATVCIDITLHDLDDELIISVNPPGQFNESDSSICFFADRDTTYPFTIIATDTCANSDTAYAIAVVNFNDPPDVNSPDTVEYFLSEPCTCCFDIILDDPDDGLTVTVSPPGQFDPSDSSICFFADRDTTYHFTIIVTDECGTPPPPVGGIGQSSGSTSSADTSYTVAIVHFNDAPVITAPDTVEYYVCDTATVCFDITLDDPDDGLNVSVNPPGQYNPSDSSICFLADRDTTYNFTIIATDSSGASDTAYTVAIVHYDDPPWVTSPDTVIFDLCEPDTVCFRIGVSDPDDHLTIWVKPPGWYDTCQYATGICFFAYTDTTYYLMAVVTDSCGRADTTYTTAIVNMNDPPAITAPDSVEYNLCDTATVCFDITLYDPDDGLDVTVNDPGQFNSSDSSVCFFADRDTTYNFTIIVTDTCGAADTAYTKAKVKFNDPPIVIVPPDTSLFQCEPETLCFTVQATDPDPGDTLILEKIEGPGVFAPDTGFSPLSDPICFLPDNLDSTYRFVFRVTNHCGATDEDTFYVTVDLNEPPTVVVPSDTSIFFCSHPKSVCFDISIFDPDNSVDVSVNSPPWHYESTDTSVCLFPSTEMTYCCTVIVTDSCQAADTGIFCVTIDFNEPPTVSVPSDTSVFLCEPETLCFPIGFSDPENSIDTIVVNPPWYYNSVDTSVCVFASSDMAYCCTVIVVDSCQAADTGSFCLTVDLNELPTILMPADTSVLLCGAETLCHPINFSDPENSIDTIIVNPPWYYNSVDNSVCVFASSEMTYCCTAIVVDSCQAADTGSFCVTVDMNGQPQVIVPPDTSVFQCEPETLCFTVQATDPDPGDTIILEKIEGPGVFAPDTGVSPLSDPICFLPDNVDSTYRFIFRVTNHCEAADEDTFWVTVDLNEPPSVQVPSDTSVFLCEPETKCFKISISDPDNPISVSVNSPWYYNSADTSVCVLASAEMTYCCTVAVTDSCQETDTGIFCVTVDLNEPPQVIAPATVNFELCGPGNVCFDIELIDPDNTLEVQVSPSPPFTYNPSGPSVCFFAAEEGTYCCTTVVTDSCGLADTAITCAVVDFVPCECLINVWIDSVDCVFPGNTVEIPVTLASDRPIGGFKLYIEYDPTVMNFLSVQRGEMIDDFDGYYDDYNHVPMYDFQYFNHRMLPCAQQCETYKIKIVGIADMPDGVINGPLEAGQGELLKLKFLVSKDANLQDLFLPVKFEFDYDFDLKAPSFSDPTGDTLYVDRYWPGETSQPNDNIFRILCFYDGGVKICSDAFCWAGDINMNEYPYEIADAVLYANYFLYGMGVFEFDPDIQVLATDVNQDGFVLSMSDFVFLVRIILEDISPKHKLAPSAEMVDVNLVSHGDAVKVGTKSSTTIGAGLYVFRHSGEIKNLTLHADMNMRYSDQDGELRVLVYSFEGKSIPAGTNDLFSFQAKEVELVEVNAADFYGQALKSTISTKVLPTEFLLMNNYPNPFNLSTSISFSLPVDSEVGLKIYNIAGRLVKSFEGEYEAGNHTILWDGTNAKGEEVASGIYLYRLVAGDYTCTKKMALMK
jgi:hypothetical protein